MKEKVLWGANPWREDAIIPKKSTSGAAASDVYAWMPIVSDTNSPSGKRRSNILIMPGQRALIRTGVNLRIPVGYCVDVKTRSGMALKQGLIVLNADGLIDDDYIGNGDDYELRVILYNTDDEPVFIEHHDRIAQLEIREKVDDELQDDSGMDYDAIKAERGTNRTGGFGSTGVK